MLQTARMHCHRIRISIIVEKSEVSKVKAFIHGRVCVIRRIIAGEGIEVSDSNACSGHEPCQGSGASEGLVLAMWYVVAEGERYGADAVVEGRG